MEDTEGIELVNWKLLHTVSGQAASSDVLRKTTTSPASPIDFVIVSSTLHVIWVALVVWTKQEVAPRAPL